MKVYTEKLSKGWQATMEASAILVHHINFENDRSLDLITELLSENKVMREVLLDTVVEGGFDITKIFLPRRSDDVELRNYQMRKLMGVLADISAPGARGRNTHIYHIKEVILPTIDALFKELEQVGTLEQDMIRKMLDLHIALVLRTSSEVDHPLFLNVSSELKAELKDELKDELEARLHKVLAWSDAHGFPTQKYLQSMPHTLEGYTDKGQAVILKAYGLVEKGSAVHKGGLGCSGYLFKIFSALKFHKVK